jgi:lysophospholipase L1-like esterase
MKRLAAILALLSLSLASYVSAQFQYTPLTKVTLAVDSFLGTRTASNNFIGNWTLPDTADSIVGVSGGAMLGAVGTLSSSIYTLGSQGQNATVAAPLALPSTAMFPNDQWIKVKAAGVIGGGSASFVLCRSAFNQATRTAYLLFINGGGTTSIQKFVADASSVLTSTAVTPANNDLWEFDCQGSTTTTLTAFRNGVQILTAQDSSSPILSGYPGLGFNTPNTGKWTNFSAGGFNIPGPRTLFIGDSWIARLNLPVQVSGSTSPGFAYCNDGIGGEDASQFAARVPTDLTLATFDYAVVQSTFNGLFNSTQTVAQSLASESTVAAAVRSAGVKVVWTTMTTIGAGASPPAGFAANVDLYNSQLHTIVNPGEAVMPFNATIDFQTTPTTINPALYLADQVHPNQAGYNILTPLFAPAILGGSAKMIGPSTTVGPTVRQ